MGDGSRWTSFGYLALNYYFRLLKILFEYPNLLGDLWIMIYSKYFQLAADKAKASSTLHLFILLYIFFVLMLGNCSEIKSSIFFLNSVPFATLSEAPRPL